MLRYIRTHQEDLHFIGLVKELDHYLSKIDGVAHAFYAPHNTTQELHHVIVAYLDEPPVGCSALKVYNTTTLEIKRMYTKREHRGKGIASGMLKALEVWTIALGYERCILEVGKRQPDAVQLYKKNGYLQIPNYGVYQAIENSLCFEKQLGR